MTEQTSCPRVESGDASASHVEVCLDCARLERARALLRSRPDEALAADLRRIWAGVERQRTRGAIGGRSGWWSRGLAGAGGALIIAVTSWVVVDGLRPAVPGAPTDEPGARSTTLGSTGGARLEVVAPTALSLGAAGRLEAEAGTVVTLDLAASVVRLEAGAGRFVVTTPRALAIHTRHGRVQVREADARIAVVAGRTTVEVRAGRVEVEIRGAPARVVNAGEVVAIEPANSGGDGQALAPPAARGEVVREAVRAPPAARAAPRVEAPAAAGAAAVVGAAAVTGAAAAAGEAAVTGAAPPAEVVPAASAAPRGEAPAADELPISAPSSSADRAPGPAADAAPPRDREVEALMLAADTARKRGDLAAALDLCLRAADHPRGTAYAEEALLRAARLQLSLDAPARADAALARARQRFPRGPLRPEREALAARLARERGDLESAHAWIESVPLDSGSLPLADERLALAAALLPRDPGRAQALARPLTAARWPAGIRARAARLLEPRP